MVERDGPGIIISSHDINNMEINNVINKCHLLEQMSGRQGCFHKCLTRRTIGIE